MLRRSSTTGFDSEPALKKAKTMGQEEPSNNNDDKSALEAALHAYFVREEKVSKVDQVAIKKEPLEQITRCQCFECPELVRTNKIKTLLMNTSDQNSNFIINLKKILNPDSPGEREYVEEEDATTVKIKTEHVTVKSEPCIPLKTEPVTVKTEFRDSAPVIMPEHNNDNPFYPSPISTKVSPLTLMNRKCEKVESPKKKSTCHVCGKQMLAMLLRPFICQQCSKTFTHASSLKIQALLHTGEKRFKCQTCGKEFFQKVAYETHCRSHTKERLQCKTSHFTQ